MYMIRVQKPWKGERKTIRILLFPKASTNNATLFNLVLTKPIVDKIIDPKNIVP